MTLNTIFQIIDYMSCQIDIQSCLSHYVIKIMIFIYAKQKINKYQRFSRACIVHLVIKRTHWSYVKTMSCSGSHLGIPINIKNTKFVKDLPMIDFQLGHP